ncbi:hypothetical protein D3C81_1443020 [compost metagenome]
MGARDHLAPLLDSRSAVDPEVAEVVEHRWIVGLLLQGGPQFRLGLGLAVQGLIGGAAQEVHLEPLVGDIEQRAVQYRQRLVISFHLHQLTGQQIGHAGLVGTRVRGAAKLSQGFVGHSVLFKAERALNPRRRIQLRVLRPHLGQGGASRRLELGLLQGLADQEAILVGRFEVQRQPEIDHPEFQNALSDGLIGGRGVHRLRRPIVRARPWR